jgi:hypothetical protein
MGGFGVLGDSNSDEYRADDNRGGSYAATTFNWVELLVNVRGLVFGPWGSRARPRRTGYEHNWALSGSTAASMISSGQHTGLAQQVASGDVSNVIIYIGVNDFSVASGEYRRIYDGNIAGQALQAKIDAFVSNVTLAVTAVVSAGSPRVVLFTVVVPALAPAMIAQFPDPARRQLVTDAIEEINTALTAMAAAQGVAVSDFNAVAIELLSRVDANGFLDVGGELIDVRLRGNEPHHLQLDDGAGHPGTVASGLLGNLLVIDVLNANYGLGIVPLSDREILTAAGIN